MIDHNAPFNLINVNNKKNKKETISHIKQKIKKNYKVYILKVNL